MHNKNHSLYFQPVVIDAPVLVKLQHGTVRYRYVEEKVDRENRIEKPHEGPERTGKDGYFYHSHLKKFGPGIYM